MARRWTSDVDAAFDTESRGVLRVVGGPGTGKTSLLVDVAAAHIGSGVPVDSVLLLTGSGPVGNRIRGSLTGALLRTGGGTLPPVTGASPVRTLHSYAFAVLQSAARRAGNPPPRLVTGAEQDIVVRELLAGDGPQAWPGPLQAAVHTDGFATELRDLLARCAERGVDPTDLMRLGRRSGRPEWTAAGRFAQQYEQVMLLRAAAGTAAPQATVPALGAAELVGAALEALAVDHDLLADERARIRVLLVDDAQQLDPQAARLVRALAAGVGRTVIAGDPDQAVFGFRGGTADGLLTDGPGLVLVESHRCTATVADAVRGTAARLPGQGAARQLTGSGAGGSVRCRLASSARAEEALIADALRRAHLVDGVPWSQMAVIVRSVPRAAARLPRALAAAGVPVTLPATGGRLPEQPAVAALLTVLTATVDGLDGPSAIALLTGPIGRMDPISLRQLRRLLPDTDGGFHDRLVAVLTGESTRLPAAYARTLQRVRGVLAAATRSHATGETPHHTLWQVWHRSGLQRRWLSAVQRGGQAGAQASRDLDAVTALFDVAEQYVARTVGSTVPGLLEHVAALRLAVPRTEPAAGVEAVSVLSAHGALGQEWDFVVVAGLQEGLWPNTVPRGGVLNTQRLLDTLDGIGADTSIRAPLRAEERRLLVAALGRARNRLLVTAVDGGEEGGDAEDQIPSGFFTELTGVDTGDDDPGRWSPVVAPPVLSAAAVVGRLRAAVCAPAGSVEDADRSTAATELARLARAGVPGADPATWHGVASVSTEEPLRTDRELSLSPSSLQTLLDCPLRWVMEQHGARDGADLRSTIGSVLHALIAETGRSETELLAELDRAWQHLPFDAQWYSDNELDRHRGMLEAFHRWRDQTRGELTEAGVEIGFEGPIDGVDGVRLRGRVDRVERDAAGRLVVVDVKTGRTPVTKDDAQRHAQLATYQLAVSAGLIAEGEESGGARLVYLGRQVASGPAERHQDPLTPEANEAWRAEIAEAAAATVGPVFTARINDGCRHCPVRPICPAHTERPGS
ncbi:ATP-dependent helicase [Mycobacterium sp. M1]|uniref:DNA 3'-5' helicase n=1 Tax=Mycolicibacter acidiphilus TaxID=2835306 RepID=A0ABS5RH82_9MYCO|nr:ATP-dependent DNA helicase [Mycolicibacter acidiphilus]MBS9533641.1 ATP-dependent helicase [Mycolicibacter acidiphilus]